jgi:ATP-binding cassette subfamily C protein CydC
VLVAVLSLTALAAVEVVLPLAGVAARYAELRGAWQRVRALLPAGSADELPEETAGVAAPAAIRLAGLTVRYPDAEVPALAGLDLELPPGRRVAIVGPSGAGKSTLLGVLSGAVPASSGSVTVGAGSAGLGWPFTGGVLADGYVFHASIRENLTLGRTGLDDPMLAGALATAGLPGWEDRLDEVVGEDGGKLSGGQRQRLLLARALVAVPPVLLLDEPTEGLDPAAADGVLADVLCAAPGHTVVLVTHRLVDLRAFDEILVLDEGRVVQRGEHATLAGQPGWYATWATEASATEASATEALAGTAG